MKFYLKEEYYFIDPEKYPSCFGVRYQYPSFDCIKNLELKEWLEQFNITIFYERYHSNKIGYINRAFIVIAEDQIDNMLYFKLKWA